MNFFKSMITTGLVTQVAQQSRLRHTEHSMFPAASSVSVKNTGNVPWILQTVDTSNGVYCQEPACLSVMNPKDTQLMNIYQSGGYAVLGYTICASANIDNTGSYPKCQIPGDQLYVSFSNVPPYGSGVTAVSVNNVGDKDDVPVKRESSASTIYDITINAQVCTLSDPKIYGKEDAPNMLRMINLPGLEFDPSGSYVAYPTVCDFQYYALAGFQGVRLPFLMERVTSWTEGYGAYVIGLTSDLTQAGYWVNPEAHNYMRVNVNGAECIIGTNGCMSMDDVYLFWRNFGQALMTLAPGQRSKVFAGLMNEPHDVPHDILQDYYNMAIAGFRDGGAENWVTVSPSNWAQARACATECFYFNNTSISDPLNQWMLELHAYCQSEGTPDSGSCNQDCVTLTNFSAMDTWAAQNGRYIYIGETGANSQQNCLNSVSPLTQALMSRNYTFATVPWAGPKFDGTYSMYVGEYTDVKGLTQVSVQMMAYQGVQHPDFLWRSTVAPTSLPTPTPTSPTPSPTDKPSSAPTVSPTAKPSSTPTVSPTFSPTISKFPTSSPTSELNNFWSPLMIGLVTGAGAVGVGLIAVGAMWYMRYRQQRNYLPLSAGDLSTPSSQTSCCSFWMSSSQGRLSATNLPRAGNDNGALPRSTSVGSNVSAASGSSAVSQGVHMERTDNLIDNVTSVKGLDKIEEEDEEESFVESPQHKSS